MHEMDAFTKVKLLEISNDNFKSQKSDVCFFFLYFISRKERGGI